MGTEEKASKSWIQTGFTVVVVGAGLVGAFILGLYGYVIATMKPLHPNAQEMSSVPQAAPAQKWAGAVEQSRQLVRADAVEHNLPGLSVAVGVDGDIVWAEGFGWADLENRVPVAPHMRFRIGTISTALTSAAIGLLLEKTG